VRLAVVAAAVIWIAVVAATLGAGGQLPNTFFDETSAPAVAYATKQPHDAIAQLNEKLAAGSTTLTYEPGSGWFSRTRQAVIRPGHRAH
jgi:hypothetical protein